MGDVGQDVGTTALMRPGQTAVAHQTQSVSALMSTTGSAGPTDTTIADGSGAPLALGLTMKYLDKQIAVDTAPSRMGCDDDTAGMTFMLHKECPRHNRRMKTWSPVASDAD